MSIDGGGGEIRCVACGTVGGLYEPGWQGQPADETRSDVLPGLAFYCPACAERDADDS